MADFDFLTAEVSQADIVAFSDSRVNLPSEDANRYREQVRNLREHLERYIEEHPEVDLAKMYLSGSLAKGTALRTINDIDVGLYVKGQSAPHELGKLLQWLVERLRKTYHQMPAEKIYVDDPCVVISFGQSGLDVEVTPILYDGDPEWRGILFNRWTGKKILTSIPMHLKFTRARKAAQPTHYAQVIRLVKWWVKQRERDTAGFAFRSFLIELIMAKLADDRLNFGDYHLGLEHFFLYIQKTGLKQRIAFTDYYNATSLPKTSTGCVEIFDPVNPENNVAADMVEADRQKLVTLAASALDALSYAKMCQTKGEALECWQELMGSSFNT